MTGKVKPRKAPGQGSIAERTTGPDSTNSRHPHFCLCDLAAGYRLSNCQSADRAAFAGWLETLSRMTWGTIQLAPKTGLGHQKIVPSSLKVPVPAGVRPDVEFFLAFRLSQKARIVGYRVGEMLHIVWVDPNHVVY